MTRPQFGGAEAALLRSASGQFSDGEIEGLPAPVARYFRAAVAEGTPLAQSARIQMRGHIKIGRWVPFKAREVLTPHVGFVWSARAAGIVSGSDRFVDGRGEMDWKLAGLIQVMQADGPDISRSAAARAAAESVWIPTALLPRFGVEWSAGDEGTITSRFAIGDHPMQITHSLDDIGRIRATTFDRWGDPDGSGKFGLHPFGGYFSAYTAFEGITIPSEGRLGWNHGTKGWSEGEFFRYRITDVQFVA